MEQFEIYLSDLTEEAQKSFLEFMGMTDGKEGNYDVFPIDVIEKYEEDEE